MIGRVSQLVLAAVFGLLLHPTVAWSQPAPPDATAVVMGAKQNRAVMLALAEVLRERFAFRERGAAAASAIEAMVARGTFDSARTAAALLDLIETRVTPIVADGHFRARYWGPEATAGFTEAPPTEEELAQYHEEVRLRGGEIPEVRWLAGNVGYLRIQRFLDTPPSVERLQLAFGMLADSAALIIDVRGAPGGEPAGVANVIGHLVSERTATVRTEDAFDPAAGRTFYAEPRTPGYTDPNKPVYVLVDAQTGSGAEEFVYDLQALRRATLVGETTSGAATPGGYRPLPEGFVAFIPMQIVTQTITGTNWEGVGVIPEVKVQSAVALTRAHRLALETVLQTAQGVHRAIAEEGLATLESPAPKPE